MLVPRGFHSKLDSVQCRILKVPSASREIPISLWGLHMLLSFEYNEEFLLAGSGPDPFSKLTSWHISENDGPAPPSRRLQPGGVAAPALSRRRRDLHCPLPPRRRPPSFKFKFKFGGRRQGPRTPRPLEFAVRVGTGGHWALRLATAVTPPSLLRHKGCRIFKASRFCGPGVL